MQNMSTGRRKMFEDDPDPEPVRVIIARWEKQILPMYWDKQKFHEWAQDQIQGVVTSATTRVTDKDGNPPEGYIASLEHMNSLRDNQGHAVWTLQRHKAQAE